MAVVHIEKIGSEVKITCIPRPQRIQIAVIVHVAKNKKDRPSGKHRK